MSNDLYFFGHDVENLDVIQYESLDTLKNTCMG